MRSLQSAQAHPVPTSCMPHASARGCRQSSDEGNHGLCGAARLHSPPREWFRVQLPGFGDEAAGYVGLTVMKAAASSSAVPPISPIKTMPDRWRHTRLGQPRTSPCQPASLAVIPSVWGSSTNFSKQSTKLVPLKGSPPMPTTVDWPNPTDVV